MPGTVGFKEDFVHWRPAMGNGSIAPDIELPTVVGDLALEGKGGPVALFLVGLGEGKASAAAAVRLWEEELRRPAVGAWLSYFDLPVNESNLTRVAEEAPVVLAEHYGNGRPVDLVTNSLGCLGVNAAAAAPEIFGRVASTAPYALTNEHRGKLPIVGSTSPARAVDLAISLGLRTTLQLRRDHSNPDLRAVALKALNEMMLYGLSGYTSAADYALSAKIGRRTADSYAKLLADHPERLVIGEGDKLVNHRQARSALGEAAMRNGIDPYILNDVVEIVPGPHTPWCIPKGREQLSYVLSWFANRDHPIMRDTDGQVRLAS